MSRERRVQAGAGLGGRGRNRSSAGASPWLVAGIVMLAVSLVAVGAVVALRSLREGGQGTAQGGAPTPTTRRPTPAVVTVGEQDRAAEGATPTTAAGAGSSIVPPATSGGPLINPAPPAAQQPGAPTSGSDPGAPSTPGPANTEPAPATVPGAGALPATAGSALDGAVAEAFGRLTTVEDQVGQLLLLAWIGNTAEEARPALRDLRAGGIVFVQNATTAAEARAINQHLKQIARDVNLVQPLLAIDHEGGIVQRITDVEHVETNWAFGARNPTDAEACQRGLDHARTLADLGFSMNLAPVLDVNNNPANPVIGTRSYSDDPHLVARLGAAYIRGLQGGGVAAVGKHFPGHGNTSVDSHLGLPSLPHTLDDLERIELVPFRAAIAADVAGIMSAHIVFPAVDPSGVPATLSDAVMTGLLRQRLGFTGLAVSDDMGAMRAITDNYAPGEAAVLAVQSGVDLLILSAELAHQQAARDALVEAVHDGRITRERLEEAVRNVLTVKARFGLLGAPPQTGGGCP